MTQAMKAGHEAKILQDTLKQLDDPDAALATQRRVNRWVKGGGSVGLMAAFVMAFSANVPAWAIVVVAGFAGIAGGAAIMHQHTLQQWPVTMRHVNREGIEARLAELANK